MATEFAGDAFEKPLRSEGFQARINQRPRLGLLIFAFAAILLLTLLGPFMTVIGLPGTGEGSPLRQGAYLVIMGLVIYGVRPIASPQSLLAIPLPICVALAWCWASVFWAIEPEIAIRRLILTTVIIWSLFITIRQLGFDRTLAMVRVALLIGLLVNYLAVIVWPDVGIHEAGEAYDRQLTGDWRGIMQHKNFAGALCAYTMLAWTFDAKRIPKVLQAAVIAATAIFLWKTGSRTSVGVCVAAMMVGFLYVYYNARYRGVALGAVCLTALIGCILLTMYNNPLTAQFNDNKAFTGRPQIWAALLDYSQDHRLLGSGYGSFWNIGPNGPIYQYSSNWVRTLTAGHNGFIDLLVQIGIPGLVLAIGATIVWPLVRLFRSPSANGPKGALIFSTILFCVCHNVTESSLLDRDVISEVFLMIAIALLWSITSGVGNPRSKMRSATGRPGGSLFGGLPSDDR
jgi:exopolysaccharide production protein ExoQ